MISTAWWPIDGRLRLFLCDLFKLRPFNNLTNFSKAWEALKSKASNGTLPWILPGLGSIKTRLTHISTFIILFVFISNFLFSEFLIDPRVHSLGNLASYAHVPWEYYYLVIWEVEVIRKVDISGSCKVLAGRRVVVGQGEQVTTYIKVRQFIMIYLHCVSLKNTFTVSNPRISGSKILQTLTICR